MEKSEGKRSSANAILLLILFLLFLVVGFSCSSRRCPRPSVIGLECASPEQIWEVRNIEFRREIVPEAGFDIEGVGPLSDGGANLHDMSGSTRYSDSYDEGEATESKGGVIPFLGDDGQIHLFPYSRAFPPYEIPLKLPPRIYRVWIPPHKTPDGKFISSRYIYFEIPGAWTGSVLKPSEEISIKWLRERLRPRRIEIPPPKNINW